MFQIAGVLLIIPSERIKFKAYLEFSNAVVKPWGIIKS